MTVRTRFAPSPTGFLHIGGVRTALYCWLLTRQNGGQFILRIDDTDEKRNVEEALQPIIDGFRWLGIDWDEGPGVDGPHAPYYQSQRSESYQAAVRALLDSGHAYRDYATSEETQAERLEAESEKRDRVSSRRWMAETDEDIKRYESEGRSYVVRLKMPREGKCEFHDLVRGDVSVDWAKEQDQVIQRNDGSCLYHLASVVDDEAFEITHVVRSVEHLANTPRQIFIINALGYRQPKYTHLPFVAEPGSKNKLSKRKIEKYLKNRDFKKLYDSGAAIADQIGFETSPASFNPVLVDFYQRIGFLPEAILNYLLLVGWSLDDKTEDFTRAQMLEHFSFDRVVKGAASFDPQKLVNFQERYMAALPVDQKVVMCMPFLQRAGLVSEPSTPEAEAYLTKIVTAAEDRIVFAGDILSFDDFYVKDEDLVYDDKAFQKRLVKPADAAPLLEEFKTILADASDFSAESLQTLLKSFCESKEIKIGQIIHAIRVAITGKAAGFGTFETLEIVGQDRCISRIENALERIRQTSA